MTWYDGMNALTLASAQGIGQESLFEDFFSRGARSVDGTSYFFLWVEVDR